MAMYLPITQRIVQFWEAKNFKSRREFAKKLRGVTINQYFSRHPKTGKFMQPSTDTLAAIAEAFPDINLIWLILGKGPMLLPENNHPMAQNVDYQELLLLALDRAGRIVKEAEELHSQLVDLKSITDSPSPPRKRGRSRHDEPSGTEDQE